MEITREEFIEHILSIKKPSTYIEERIELFNQLSIDRIVNRGLVEETIESYKKYERYIYAIKEGSNNYYYEELKIYHQEIDFDNNSEEPEYKLVELKFREVKELEIEKLYHTQRWTFIPNEIKELHFPNVLKENNLEFELVEFYDISRLAKYKQIIEYIYYLSGERAACQEFYKIFDGFENKKYIYLTSSKEKLDDCTDLIKLDNNKIIVENWGSDIILFEGSEEEFKKKYSEILFRALICSVPLSIAYSTRSIINSDKAVKVIEELKKRKENVKEKNLQYKDITISYLNRLLGFRLRNSISYKESLDTIMRYLTD